jgi:glutamyl-tRNA synthetase
VHEGKAYACSCTRKDVDQAASAPHAEDGAAVYPGTCRGRFKSIDEARRIGGREPSIRCNVGHDIVRFNDDFSGSHEFQMSRLGDFVIEKADRTSSYQLSVVIDDAAMGITHVVRGDDLLDSTPRQILLYRALGLAEKIPHYLHLPLVVGEDGKRLAKRHGDTRISYYRQLGVSPQRLLALLARWCGFEMQDGIQMKELLLRFEIDRVQKTQIVFTSSDDKWLTQA